MKRILFTILLAAPMFNSFAQDAEGCKDHPLVNRMPNYIIESCTENFNSVNVPTANEKVQPVEGTVTAIRYIFNEETGEKLPSSLQVIRNYESAILAKGGKKIFGTNAPTDDANTRAVFKSTANGKDVWVTLSSLYEAVSGGVSYYDLTVIEVEAMKQDVSAGDMMNALNTDGFIALNITFDTGKSTIKAESQKIIDQMHELLKTNPGLKISIEGHTDNVGNAAANKTLSESRAKAVMDALVAKGIDKTRLASKGFGQEKPVADNGTDEGKAKNRRVEIRKI